MNPPRDWRGECRNRKNSLSLNVMLICGASYRIYACVSKYGGSNHDSQIFKNSRLPQLIRDGQFEVIPNGVLLGDQAYDVSTLGLITLLLLTINIPTLKGHDIATPFSTEAAEEDPEKDAYNDAHAAGRSPIENVNGVLKNRLEIFYFNSLILNFATFAPYCVNVYLSF